MPEDQVKQKMKAATEEKSHLCKEKQTKNQAKATEHQNHQNQENICKSPFTSTMLLLNTCSFISWHKTV